MRHAIRIPILLLALLAAACLGGCGIFSQSKSGGQMGGAARIGVEGLAPDELQALIEIFADRYVESFSEAIEDMVPRLESNSARAAAFTLRVENAEATFRIAATPNPVMALIDMGVLVSLQLRSVEQHYGPVVFENKAEPLERALERRLAEIRQLGERVLSPAQSAELTALGEEWHAANPGESRVSHVRISTFARSRPRARTEPRVGSLFSLFLLDPLASLDPTTRQLEESRLFAERALFHVQRMPQMIAWTTQAIYYQLLQSDATQDVLEDLELASVAADSFANSFNELGEWLPDAQRDILHDLTSESGAQLRESIELVAERTAREREALMEDLFAGLASEREQWLADLRTEDEQIRGALAELRGTLEAGTELASQLDTTVQSFDAMSARLAAERAERPEREPVDLAEIQTMIVEGQEVTRQLNEVIGSAERLLTAPAPEGDVALAQLRADAQGIVDDAYRRGLILLGVFFAGCIVTIVVHRLTARMLPKRA